MSADSAFHPRNELRYEFLDKKSVVVTLEPEDHRAEPIVLVGRLINLSAGGAKISLPVVLQRDRRLRVKVYVEELGLTFHLSAHVCWSAADGEQASIVGCRLSPTIPEGLLKNLAQVGQLERRDDARHEESRSVRLSRKGLLLRKSEPAELRNIASGGLCLVATKPATIGESLRVSLDDCSGKTVEVVVRWQLEQDHRFVLGCEYAASAQSTFESISSTSSR